MSKNVNTCKSDSTENWNKAMNFVPSKGEVIIYSDVEQMKVGDGVNSVVNLPFKDREYEDGEIEEIYNSVR